MEPAVRAARQKVTEALGEARKLGGPKTPEGKSRSAMNALRHGLTANHLVLPGEDAQAYEHHLDGYFATFAPTTLPEAHVVAQLGDLSWKLERLSKLENNRLRARLEEELEKTDEHVSIRITRQVREMVNALAETVDAVPEPPADPVRTEALLLGVKRLVEMLREVPKVTPDVVHVLANALAVANESIPDSVRLTKDAYVGLGNASKVVRGALTAKLADEEASLESLRERLATEVLLLEDADLKKMEKYRRTLEASLLRQTELLGKMRSLVAAAEPQARSEAQELRVKLRVVN